MTDVSRHDQPPSTLDAGAVTRAGGTISEGG